MKAALLALALFAAPCFAEPPPQPMPFAPASELWVATSQVRLYSDNAVYAQTHLESGACIGHCQEGKWQRVDLKPFGVASDAKAAFLSGILLITHGAANEIADLHVTFRRLGDTTASCDKYIGQTVEAHVNGGQRSGISTFVPLYNGEFEWCYTVSTSGNWPANSAYGVNLSLQAWMR